MTYLRIITTFLTFNILLSCASLLVTPMNEIPAPDRIFIHKSPKVGDFATYSGNNGAVKKRFEVVKLEKKTATIRYKVIYEDQSEDEIQWFYRKVDLKGNVLQAWMIEAGKRLETPVASSGAMSGLEHIKYIDKPSVNSLTTSAGEFKVSGAYNYIFRLDLGIIKTKSTHFDLISNEVPFLLVRSEIVATDEKGPFLRALEFIDKHGEDIYNKDYFAIYKLANPESTSRTVKVELIEFGFGK